MCSNAFLSLPCPRVVSYNATSLRSLLQKKRKKTRFIRSLMNRNDVGFFQETKLMATDIASLKKIFPHCAVFYNNNPENTGSKGSTFTAGTAIVVSNKFLKKHDAIVSTDDLIDKGHIQKLRISCKKGLYSYNLLNLRLATGKPSERRRQLKLLKNLPLLPNLICGGDFNFCEYKEDGNSLLTVKDNKTWRKFVYKQNIRELSQPLPTFISSRMPKDGSTPVRTSSRLDRF
jgi:exonuclease III